MNTHLQQLKENIESLIDTISASNVTRDSFQDHGWNQLSLDKDYIEYLAKNFLNDVEIVTDKHFDDQVSRLQQYLQTTAKHVEKLNQNVKAHLVDDANNLLYAGSNTIVTLLTLSMDFKETFLKWEALQGTKFLPQSLSRRVKATEARIANLNLVSEDIESKIIKIQDAYDAAENLPTYLQEIHDGKKDLEAKLAEAKTILEKIEDAERFAQSSLEDNRQCLQTVRNNAEETDSLRAKCDDNLQITTTQGLAAGFDQKAQSLSSSIKYWVIGLIAALCSGAYFGGEQVQKLSAILDSNQQVGAGFAIINIVLALFSIGGPLWFAWLATQQINQRFKLSEDYAYKATVAKSYTGFSKHATRFDEQTAERLFNSTLDRLDEMPLRLVEGKDYNSPWHEFIDSEAFKKALDMVPDLADKASTFAARTKLKNKPSITTQQHTHADPNLTAVAND
ncbi:hypothetical protein L2725_03685 [Shewanella corallii]|uniref:Uncharacterized protein n=1 Tax=Shewanella corallii TaxID=560080 RepID=A0ABT0N4R5_9GAMM|nr:hypothetical protein [Shewanella corallii]MCL2912886.1 hypothetical protein [Shewanella corallii]